MKIYGPLILTFLFGILAISPSVAQQDLPAIIKRIEPSIVVILAFDKEGKGFKQGSGFFVNNEGDVITSSHVLQGANHAEVKAADGKVYPVKEVLAEDMEGDLIQVSIDIPKDAVRPLSVSTSLPEVGERVIVIGTPFGLEKTVSDGIVSALREIPGFGKIIQVTAPISPGSSGSPVVNMNGEAIGVATFIILAGQNLNFAIPGERIAKLRPAKGQSLSEREETRIEEWLGSPEGLYTTGLRYLWAEEYEKALPYFLEVVKKNPDHAEAYFQIGYCRGKLGRYQEAIEPYKEAIRIKPDNIDTYNNLCVAYGMVGRFVEAIESCKKAILLKPDLAEAHSNLGWSYHKLGRYQEAIESCKRAAHYNLGSSYTALGQYEEAIESYKQAIRIKFDYAEAHLDLGAAYFQRGRYEEAIVSYKQAIRIKPIFPEAYLNLGMTYLRTGDRGSALEEYRLLKELDRELANKLFNLIYE
jgi:tetratricopeptide (TPR) repeat protein